MACFKAKRPHRYVRWECSGTEKSLTLSSGLCVYLGKNGPQELVKSDKTSLQGYPGKSSKVKGFINKIINGWTLVTWNLVELIAAPASLYNCVSLERSLVLSVVFMHQTQHVKTTILITINLRQNVYSWKCWLGKCLLKLVKDRGEEGLRGPVLMSLTPIHS